MSVDGSVVLNSLVNPGRPQAAPGHDHIPNLEYKKLSTVLGPPIATIFNACLELGYSPATFRIAQVVNVPKAGKDPTSAAGYRPIALLSTLGKKLESLLCRRLVEHMEARKIWSPHQYGFRRRKSTTQALIRLLDRAALALNHRIQMVAVSFDLQAAFDSTHPDILWRKLQEAEVPQYLLRLLDGFFRNREARLLLGQEQWPFFPTIGFPQSSPLSPVLFLTFADGLLQALTGSVEGQMYADDLIIWIELRADGTDATDLQMTLRKIEEWTDRHELTFNAERRKHSTLHAFGRRSVPLFVSRTSRWSPNHRYGTWACRSTVDFCSRSTSKPSKRRHSADSTRSR